ncbi:hypothetical protein M0R45_014134 [Rubus argutus]|uniref:RING-type domain-containing protein n=1 Tax=Rubus argutus TaxID=59490 RepID=A0AAW1XKI8_RUBAR
MLPLMIKRCLAFTLIIPPCHGFEEVLSCYKRIVPSLRLSGPTSYGPMARLQEASIPRQGTESTRGEDNQSNCGCKLLSTLYYSYWKFDNFQFVNFTDIMAKQASASEKEAAFALAALMEIPLQYKAAVEFGILGRTTGKGKKTVPRPPPVPYTHRPPPTHEPSALSAPVGDDRSEMVCPICLTNAKDLAFGCGHMTCRDCGARLSNCHICRQPIRSRLRVYSG